MKKLLILGAGIYQVPLIQKAKEMGLYTIVASYAGNYPGLKLAHEVWDVNTTDYATLTRLSKEAGISGVTTSGTDVAVISLGAICEALDLPGVSSSCARLVTDKAKMKDALLSHGVSTPKAVSVTSLREAQTTAAGFSFPLMVKAVDSSGSRGITRVNGPEELEDAFLAAKAVTRKDYVLLEEYIQGQEIGVDGFVSNGRLCFLLPHKKFTCQAGGVTLPEGHRFPYEAPSSLLEQIQVQMEGAVTALGLNNCAVNADVMIDGDHVFLLEVGARAGATCIPELISTYCGFDYYREMILQALGETPAFAQVSKRPCMAKLLFSGEDGILTSMDEKALFELRKKCVDLSLDYPMGSHVEQVENGTSRIGQVILETSDEEELDKIMSLVRRAIKVNGVDLETLWNNRSVT